MEIIKKKIRKATIFIVAFFLNTQLMATVQKIETASDIIEKAYNLSLQKERSQAVLLLVNAIKKESKKSTKIAKELIKSLEQVSTVFYSDKAQQLFELGASLRMSDPNTALVKMNEAIKLEPENQSIFIEQMRISIANGDCSTAVDQLKKAKEKNPFSEGIDLTLSQAAVCSGQFEIYQQLKRPSEEKKGNFAAPWGLVDVEYLFKTGNIQKAKDLSLGLQKVFPEFPEPHYWQWKTESEMKLKAEAAGIKYLNLCKALSTRAQREFMSDPFLCRRTTEIENFLKKNNSSI